MKLSIKKHLFIVLAMVMLFVAFGGLAGCTMPPVIPPCVSTCGGCGCGCYQNRVCRCGDTCGFETPPLEDISQDGMILTFRDEFASRTIADHWDFQLAMGSQGPNNPWGNRELQFYRQENATIRNGQLVITARRENVIFRWLGNQGGGLPNFEELYVTNTPLDEINFSAIPALANYTASDVTILPRGASNRPPSTPGRLFMSEFTSARMRTANSFNQMFGRFEARISLPARTAMWPAFWMMPERNTITGGGWPRNGEIDIMEARGRNPYVVTQTVHIGVGTNARHRWLGRSPDYRLPEGVTIDNFIYYRIDWHPNRISWYVNDVNVFNLDAQTWRLPSGSTGTQTNPGIDAGWGGVWYNPVTNPNQQPGLNTAQILRPDRPYAPFDHPFHMILNVAVGGWYDDGFQPRDYDGYRNCPVHMDGVMPRRVFEERFEYAEMRVDWVRAWQFEEYQDWYFCFDTNTPIMPGWGD